MSDPEDASERTTPKAIWGDANFVRYWAGHAMSAFGDQITALALPLIAVVLLEASPSQVGALTASVWAPNLLALLFGTWIDEFGQQQRLLIAADVFRGATLATIPIAYQLGQLSMPVLYGFAVALGVGGVVYNSSYPSFFVRLVPKTQFIAANSVLSTTMSIAALAGPASAGLLIQAISAPNALIVDAATFLLSAMAILTVRAQTGRAADGHVDAPAVEPYLLRLRSGLSYLRGHAYLRASLMASTMMNIAGFAIQAVLILYAVRHLHMSAGQIGIALGRRTAGRVDSRIGQRPTQAAGRSRHAGARAAARCA